MIVPKFWAEGRAQHRKRRRQVTVRRFGWSDLSIEEAQTRADERANLALQQVLNGASLLRREPKVAYNGAEGVPIREEILSHFGETVITRNAYGAQCLNTPNVLFGDIDLTTGRRRGVESLLSCLGSIAALVLGIWLAMSPLSWTVKLPLALGILLLPILWIVLIRKLIHTLRGGDEGLRERRRRGLERFSETHPDWHLRMYETPAGFRVLAMHRTFLPADPEVAEFFCAIGADPVYARMCLRQNCFRARVSPKPWRIGLDSHISPGTWPVAPERQPEREEWVREYEAQASAYASCRFVDRLGSHHIDPAADAVRKLHDQLSGAETKRPLA